MAKFERIETRKQLEAAIAFLSDGYNWSEPQACAIRGGVLACNGEVHPYGAWSIDDEGRVVNAILFFYQGKIRHCGSVKTVIGTSSWYADEAHRGLEAIRFLSRAADYLKSHYDVITNYTPNDIATDLYRRLGFDYQGVMRVRLFAWNALRRRPPGMCPTVEEDHLEYLEGFNFLGNLRRVTLRVNGAALALTIRVRTVKKLHVPLRIVEVLWTNRYKVLSENLALVTFKLCVREKAIAVDFYLTSAIGYDSCAWLIFDPDGVLPFVSPAQSELTCI